MQFNMCGRCRRDFDDCECAEGFDSISYEPACEDPNCIDNDERVVEDE